MKSLLNYAIDSKLAYESYIKENGIDDYAKEIYDLIQKIEKLDNKEIDVLDKFIADYSIEEKHLADITYINDDGEEGVLRSLLRMRPIKLSKTNKRIYEARNNSFDFALNNRKRKSIKVYQKAYMKIN